MSRPLVLALAATAWLASATIAAEDGVVQVKLGATVERSFDAVKTANWAYGPQQDVDGATGETHVYLPYGNNPKLYWGPVDGVLGDPKPGQCAEFVSAGGDHAAKLTYKLVFDKPISAFRAWAGYTELVQSPTAVAGVEYSTDGKAWKTLKEHPKGTRAVVGLVDKVVTITGLDSRELYLRIYARDSANPTAATGPEMYLKTRISGDPGWGDAATTFAQSQNQIWVTAK